MKDLFVGWWYISASSSRKHGSLFFLLLLWRSSLLQIIKIVCLKVDFVVFGWNRGKRNFYIGRREVTVVIALDELVLKRITVRHAAVVALMALIELWMFICIWLGLHLVIQQLVLRLSRRKTHGSVQPISTVAWSSSQDLRLVSKLIGRHQVTHTIPILLLVTSFDVLLEVFL